MSVEYDKYYKKENLFGEPYPELIEHFAAIERKGKLLDLGCGQGRDSIALAKLGYEVVGVDHSEVGINQLNEVAKKENLNLKGVIADIYEFQAFDEFNFILLDSMFHFGKREKEKETRFLKRIFQLADPNTQITICIQNSGKKLATLNSIISEAEKVKIINNTGLVYEFEDKESGHTSRTKYQMVTILKTI